MTEFESNVSGIAGEIRRATDSDTYDLAGYNESRIKELIKTVFATPLSAPAKMIRCTFIVGGGRLVRARYHDDMTKWVAAALREIQFEEDKSAAETFDSQGTYKYQHDTGANLKYIIIYPRVTCCENSNSNNVNNAVTGSKPLNISSYKCTVLTANLTSFQDCVNAKVYTWKAKKRLLKYLQDQVIYYQSIEKKLFEGQMLSEIEQFYYDNNGGCENEKIAWLQNDIKTMVANGQLTSTEKGELIGAMKHNVDTLTEELQHLTLDSTRSKCNATGTTFAPSNNIDTASTATMITGINDKIKQLNTKKSNLEKLVPLSYPVKNSEELTTKYIRLFSLQQLEAKGRNCSLTLADLKQLEEKAVIENEIKRIINTSKGWFFLDNNEEENSSGNSNCANLSGSSNTSSSNDNNPAGAAATAEVISSGNIDLDKAIQNIHNEAFKKYVNRMNNSGKKK